MARRQNSTTFYIIVTCSVVTLLLICLNKLVLLVQTDKRSYTKTDHHLIQTYNLHQKSQRISQEEKENFTKPYKWREIFSFVPLGSPHCDDLLGDFAVEDRYPVKLRNSLAKLERQLVYVLRDVGMTVDKIEGTTAKYHTEYITFWELTKKSHSFVRNICETGFNAGHSSLLWLTGNSKANIYSFDLGTWNYSRPMAEYINRTFPDRFHIFWGESSRTLLDFQKSHPGVKCDLILIDGGHSMMQAYTDWINFRDFARKDALIILDNYPDKRYINLGRFWEDAKQDGEIIEVFRCNYRKMEQGFVFGRLNLK